MNITTIQKYISQYGKYTCHFLSGQSQISSYNLRKALAGITYGKRAGKEIVHGSGKYCTENNPKIGCRTELRSHYSSEYRTKTGNVKKLNHKNLPCRKRNKIHSIRHSHGRSLARDASGMKSLSMNFP